MKWINTKVVIDIESGKVLEREGFWHDGPIAETKPGKSSAQKNAETRSTADAAQQDRLTGAAQGTLSQFEGPVDQSPFYKSLLTAGTEATSNAYQNAQRNVRQRANQAGFGYEQPVSQGAEGNIQEQEAEALARVPTQSLFQATGPALQAAGDTARIGAGYGDQALAYNQQSGNLENARRKSFFDTLQSVGQDAATAATFF